MDESVFIHPTANINTEHIGKGTRIWAFVSLQKDCRIGEDCNLCDYSAVGVESVVGNGVTIKEYAGIGQGTIVEDFVFIGPGVYTPNDSSPRSPRLKEYPEIAERYAEQSRWMKKTRICRGASIGTGAIIGPGLTIGAFSMVGIGAVVTKDVPAHRFVAGHPARGIAWMCFCGQKLEAVEPEGTLRCGACSRTFRKNEEGSLDHVETE